MAKASVLLMNLDKTIYDQHTSAMQSHINVGCGQDVSLAELDGTVAQVIGYLGAMDIDSRKPDDAPRTLMDSSRIHSLGWQARVKLSAELHLAYQEFAKNHV